MQQILVCTECNAQISEALTIIEEGHSDFPDLIWSDKKPLSVKGVALLRHKPYSYNPLPHGPKPALDFVPCYLLRLDDIKQSVQVTRKRGRTNGCCGLDGCDGPNKVCGCGNFVGTEKSDCWTPRVFIPDNENTKWQKMKS